VGIEKREVLSSVLKQWKSLAVVNTHLALLTSPTRASQPPRNKVNLIGWPRKFVNPPFMSITTMLLSFFGIFDIVPYEEGEFVCDSPLNKRTNYFTYVYECFFTKLGVRLPYTDFQCEILRVLNIAPTQLHPGLRAFLRSFEVICGGIRFSPSTYVSFSFFVS
jgi:hypothetical protein